MTTPYEQPQQKITQQFASGTVGTFVPTLYACICGPVYDIIVDESSGDYISEEKEFAFGSTHSVDIRTSDNNEILYPLTLTLADAEVLQVEGAGGETATGDAYSFVDTAFPAIDPFDFELITGEYAYLRFAAGTYEHTLPGTGVLSGIGPYVITTSTPVFYAGDYDSESTPPGTIVATIDFIDSASAPKTGTITGVTLTAPYTVTFTSTGAPATGECTEMVITRPALLLSEKLLKRIRSITDKVTCKLYTAREGVAYSIGDYDLIRKLEITIPITGFAARGITVNADGFTLPAFLEDGNSHIIELATVKATYRSLRNDKFETLTGYDTLDALAIDYTVNKYNTAVWMVANALTASGGRLVLLAPVSATNFYSSPVTAYAEVLAFVKEQELPFGIVLASMDDAVTTLLTTHVKAASAEDISNFRRGYASHKLKTEDALITAATTGAGYVDANREGFTGNALYDADSTFLTQGVEPGHCIKVTFWTAVEPMLLSDNTGSTVDSCDNWATANTKVVLTGFTPNPGNIAGKNVRFPTTTGSIGLYSDQTRGGVPITTGQGYGVLGYRVISSAWLAGKLTVYLYTLGTSEAVPSGGLGHFYIYDGPLSLREEITILNQNKVISNVVGENKLVVAFKSNWTATYTGIRYDVLDVYTKDEQCEKYGAYAEAIAERRMTIIYPDYYQDVEGDVMPAYFMASARAGWVSYHPPQEPMSNTFLSGFYKLLRTDLDKYFKDSNFNKMAAGGVEIYLQTVAGAGIRCRHQLTTDRSSIATQEETSTRSVDTACKMLKAVIRPLLARYNIGPDLFSVLHTRIAGVRELVTSRPIANFGSILKSFEITTLAQDPLNADGLILEIDSVTQKPFNRIHTTMRIS